MNPEPRASGDYLGGIYLDGRHYDLQHAGFTDDIPFYLKQARELGGEALELACGTGRITIPLAEAGLSITGLDLEEAMLRRARAKAAEKGVTVEWVRGDCRSLDLGRKFDLIFFPFNSIAHLHDPESIRACFSGVGKHLSDRGRFIVDIFNPRLDMLMRDPSERYPVAEYPDPDGRGTVLITENNVYDAATQVNHIKWYYRVGEGAGERVAELNMRIFFPQELDALLRASGLEIEAKYGDFDESPFVSGSPRQIIRTRPGGQVP
jgi:SAM-dependent methyltransferase